MTRLAEVCCTNTVHRPVVTLARATIASMARVTFVSPRPSVGTSIVSWWSDIAGTLLQGGRVAHAQPEARRESRSHLAPARRAAIVDPVRLAHFDAEGGGERAVVPRRAGATVADLPLSRLHA